MTLHKIKGKLAEGVRMRTRTAYVKAPYQFKIEDVPIRELASNEVLIKVKASGICGTDLHNASILAKDWMTFGHEIAGIVEKVGEAVKTVKVGDKVALQSSTYCGKCDLCRNGRNDLCYAGPNYNWGKEPMGFSDYMIAPEELCVKFDKISFEEAAMIEPMGVALDLAYTADIKLNDDVLVIGLGPIGLMALRIAKLMGARKIYAAQPSRSKRRIELAREYGADEIIFTDKVDIENYKFDKGGVEKVLVTAPPKVIPRVIDTVLYGGIIAFIGIEYGEGANITFDANSFHFKKLQLRASYAVPAIYFPRCIDMVRDGLVDVKKLISHTFKLEDIEKAMLTLKNDKENIVKMIMVNDLEGIL